MIDLEMIVLNEIVALLKEVLKRLDKIEENLSSQ